LFFKYVNNSGIKNQEFAGVTIRQAVKTDVSADYTGGDVIVL
jgi:hypothetical protein